MRDDRPNVVFVFADQLRACATGFGGDPNAKTPHLDQLAAESLNFITAVSSCPVCSPTRASLLSGLYPDRHGVFLNDVCLQTKTPTLGQVFAGDGYQTGYIGKWHVDDAHRSGYIPPERRQGFDFWRVEECTHNYNKSFYYAKDGQRRQWEGYDAIAQTREAIRFFEDRAAKGAGDESTRPFLLMLSWGPPHSSYQTAPEKYRAMFDAAALKMRPNVPPEAMEQARKYLAGYYAHLAALDDCVGMLREALDRQRIADNTILVFWSDHGDMLGSQGMANKQKPWDESIMVPLLVRYPGRFGACSRKISTPITTPDLMPTLAGLCRLQPPAGIHGVNYAPFLRGEALAPADDVLIACYAPFSEWSRQVGGREYRGLRTERNTYVRDLSGPWLLYDNAADSYQLTNLIGSPAHQNIRAELDRRLMAKLEALDDQFEPAQVYIDRWGHQTDEQGQVPYKW